ncbi:ATP-binding protein [Sulfitobacter sp. D35]|uniref:sensor histidine kinase n=1 Tax=Sulfitobacter sp. D35 TaxID=3083252 RepID=UPI00296E29A1|nr:ATP-binding protein [Sulfitobacter sp. D35]MDW4496741.1 ATP-binding protein [Sulfitobacter sp. D35]
MNGFAHRAMLVIGFLALVALVAAGVFRYGYRQGLDQLAAQGEADLALAADRLMGPLQRYRVLAVQLADHPVIRDLVDGQGADAARQLFQEGADKTGALDVMFVDRSGRVSVAARGAPGADLSASAIIRRAFHGALGRGHGADMPLDARAYAYAAPSFGRDGKVDGVIVVAADIEAIEDGWRGNNRAVFFTDARGRVIVSNRSELASWQRDEGGSGIVPTGAREAPVDVHVLGGHEIWEMDWGPYLPARALHLVRPLPIIGLTGELLLDVTPAARVARLQAAAVAALCLAFGALLFLATERRRTLALANAQLEARVADRTRALSETNARLIEEAREREAAQAALALAQEDLVRAGKLSALGQMSAGISHELNQPLMAIRSFADNAVKFFERDEPARAAENLARISDLSHRMARIIRNLRAFARQESVPQGRIDVAKVLESALDLTAARRESVGVTLHYDPPDTPVWARGGEVRLGQVFVNLIANAADAMDGRATRVLTIAISTGDPLTVSFRDTGPGIDVPDKVFDPFYTTKTVGSGDGMGLGLSISYGIVQSFGGDIRGENVAGGAQFTVTLERMEPQEVAA